VGLAAALAVVLSFFRVALFPAGGEISLEMLPILFIALTRGPVAGATCGILYGLIHWVQDPRVVHPAQYILDFPAAYGALGAAGLFTRADGTGRRILAITAAVLARYAFHVVSGLIFFKPLQGSALGFSLLYNASYIVPEYLLVLALLPAVLRRVRS